MGLLIKFKKKSYQGFKKLTHNLEGMEQSKMNNVLLLARLEDPIYISWIEKNIAPFESFFKLTKDEVALLLNQLPSPDKILVWAFYLSPEEGLFLKDLLPKRYANRYQDEIECTKIVTIPQFKEARRKLLVNMRKMQDLREITPCHWLFPTEEILTGKHYRPVSSGPFEMHYENGKIALQGQFEKKKREGEWKHFYPNGKLFAKGIYIGDEKNGEWQFFNMLEHLEQKGRYQNDSKIGNWEYWEDGKIKIK